MALMMEAVCNSEISVYFYETTWRYIQEGSHSHAYNDLTVHPASYPVDTGAFFIGLKGVEHEADHSPLP
jgi:hypothetical protein